MSTLDPFKTFMNPIASSKCISKSMRTKLVSGIICQESGAPQLSPLRTLYYKLSNLVSISNLPYVSFCNPVDSFKNPMCRFLL